MKFLSRQVQDSCCLSLRDRITAHTGQNMPEPEPETHSDGWASAYGRQASHSNNGGAGRRSSSSWNKAVEGWRRCWRKVLEPRVLSTSTEWRTESATFASCRGQLYRVLNIVPEIGFVVARTFLGLTYLGRQLPQESHAKHVAWSTLMGVVRTANIYERGHHRVSCTLKPRLLLFRLIVAPCKQMVQDGTRTYPNLGDTY